MVAMFGELKPVRKFKRYEILKGAPMYILIFQNFPINHR
jgi:hypothetical protein